MKLFIIINFVVLTLASTVSAKSNCSSKIKNQGYECCSSECEVVYTDEDGNWGVENDQWCGCEDTKSEIVTTECATSILEKGYSCCPKDCKVLYTDEEGTWGINNYKWCICNSNESDEDFSKIVDRYIERVNEVTGDDKEIERKWLLDKEKIPYDLTTNFIGIAFKIKQTYICFDPEIRVREYTSVSNNGLSYEMTIKTNLTEDGLIRDEVNIPINKEQYDNMIKKQEGNVIYKTRYQLFDDGELVAIDIFEKDLEGLAYMEIEFANKSESDAYKTPDWVIKEVTDDIRYKNGRLSRYGIPESQ
ncbi:hypothetical protein H8356DRAFT_1648349 [Neocallimastix lanati (nom. inval.)]|jgi:CYTH domain-containing protein|uniref:CBM10 domain-containing protein n=1 Tax=Neocallimastix californiae TaxID=1754190 RepID=A0A1Y2AKZ6_9FUNG|nr:hypothetical protein H8356DRAFT_1648349 [Neocallimastix sp. JGI-2020a]ORY23239.1 hypothetical protein LY90DRAFT_124562 [Neocallimastix californiae]|eukprot:ORY23239.1 hypothetical protein LY90DRAFT_124562 [Neocallimastix californiae]